jgi:hypothetical protein
MHACVEEIDYRSARVLDKSVIRSLTQQSAWVGTRENVFVLGPTGRRQEFFSVRIGAEGVPRWLRRCTLAPSYLFRDLPVARADTSLRSLLARLSRIDV